MVRKLALAVSFALGTISVPVYALGLGELSSKSTLNQNFEGNIPLLSVLPEELDGVRVNLADTAIFERAGVERPFYLSLLKFEPVLTDSGNTVVRVTSEFPVREPFLNFLVEVNWPKGRLVREYTVLLDPPTTTMRRAPKVSPAATAVRTAVPQSKPSVAASPASTAPVASASGSEYGPVKANDTAWRIAEQVRPSGVSMEQMMMALLEANPQAFIDGNINRLRKGQILRVPSAPEIQQLSRQQARQAFRQQQDAWLAQRNQGPQATTEAAEASGEAEVAVGDTATAQPDADQLRIATARPEGEGEAGAGDDAAESTTPTDLETRLIAARENAETSRQEAEMMRSRVDDLQARLEKMQKLLSLKDEQLAQLQDRVATEGVAATPEAVLEELALANQIDAAEQAAEGVDEVPPSTVVAEELAAPEIAPTMIVPGSDYQIEDIPPQIDPDRIVEAAERGEDLSAYLPAEVAGEGGFEVAEAMAPEVLLPGVQADAEIVVDADLPVADEIVVGVETSEAESAMTQPAPPVPDAAPTPESPAAADSGPTSLIPQPIARMIEQNILPIAGAGVALLALIGWGATRRRRQAQPAASPAPVAPAAAVAVAEAKTKAPEPAKQPVDQPAVDKAALEDLPDSTLLDDFSQSDINALQDETGEVDPVSEADVYIAYGRYQQAEELLRQALGRDPNRLALKHKLLEVHYATKNSGAFAALAQEMVEAGQDAADARAWARARDMGRDLAPDNALFGDAGKEASGDRAAAAAGAAVATVAAAATVDDDTLTLDDLELSELNAAYDDEPVAPDDIEAPSEVSISLDLDEPSELTELVEDDEPSVETVAIADELPASIQLDELDSMEFKLPAAAEGGGMAAQASGAEGPIAADSLDLDSMMAEAEAVVDEAESELSLDSEFSADDLQAQLDELSDLSVLDSELQEASEGDAEPKATLGLVAEDATPSGDNLDRPISLDEAFAVEEPSEEIIALDELVTEGESGDGDDVATKLDLARAYVDMGDEDGARSILEEVVAEGSDSQRGDAENILAKLG